MLRDVFGLIYAGEQNIHLVELVAKRAVGALPLAGRYRAIDFVLSNMVNSGVRNVGVVAQKNYHSLMEHLASGKVYGLSRKNGGLFVMPPFDTSENRGDMRGICDVIANAAVFIRNAPEKYCLLTGSYTIYNADYTNLMQAHKENRADVTMLYSEQKEETGCEAFRDCRIATDEQGWVTAFEVNPRRPHSRKAGMDIYLVRKDLLTYLAEDARSRGCHDWVRDVLIPNVEKLRIFAVRHKGYVGRLCDVVSYFKLNKDILDYSVRKELFSKERMVYTGIKDEVPAEYGAYANVRNSIVADGCVIEGTVEDSVLFRGVYVGRDTVIRGSVILQDSRIYQNCHIENAILDKRVHIRPGKQLMGDHSYPLIIKKEAIL